MPLATKLGRMVTYLEQLQNHKVTWPYDYVVFSDHVRNYRYISFTTMLMATNPDRMVTYFEWLLPIKSDDQIMTIESCGLMRFHGK